MPARLRPRPITISSTKSVRACGNATPFSTTLGCVCSRANTSLRKASGLAIFMPLMSDASTCTISRIAFAGFRERNRRITCCSISRSASAMGMENRELLQGEWKKLVCEDLILPSFKITKLEAIGRRLKRNYVFIFILILVAWLTKIFLHATAPITDVVSFYQALRIGHIPSWVVAMVFVGTFISVISITISVSKHSSGEISDFGTHRSLWRI